MSEKVPFVLTRRSAIDRLFSQGLLFCGDAFNVLRHVLRRRPKYHLCVTATLKNEAPYVREWIEYHRIVGVEKFFLYDNESTDNLQIVLAPYIHTGIVEFVPWPGQKQQLPIYSDAFRRFGHQTQWMAVIDADEFLYPVHYDSVPDVLREFESFGGVTANWMMFDSNGHETKPSGLVVESYRRRLPFVTAESCHIKTVCKPAYTRAFMSPHVPSMRLSHHVVNQAREPMLCPFNYIRAGTDKLMVFHYWTKSREEFLAKLARGRILGETLDVGESMQKLNFEHFEFDNGMDRFIPELKRRLGCRDESSLVGKSENVPCR